MEKVLENEYQRNLFGEEVLPQSKEREVCLGCALAGLRSRGVGTGRFLLTAQSPRLLDFDLGMDAHRVTSAIDFHGTGVSSQAERPTDFPAVLSVTAGWKISKGIHPVRTG